MIRLAIFIISYAGIALGRFPGLAMDRTGIALLGAIAMVVAGQLSLHDAIYSIDIPTILLLYSLMIISAQLRQGGFYTWCALKITKIIGQPKVFLLLMMTVSALLSSVLTNDIICLAFTPVILLSLSSTKLNPLPFLIGLAIASNIGSAATIIGNPQNILIGQVGNLQFKDFFLWCSVPSLLSLIIAYFFIIFSYRKNFINNSGQQNSYHANISLPCLDKWKSAKGILAVTILIILLFTRFPRELSAITIAGVILCSRKFSTREIFRYIDWNLLILFCSLFIIIDGISTSKYPELFMHFLSSTGIDLNNLNILTIVSALISNMFSNVPAVILLSRMLQTDNTIIWYVLSVSSTFAGNFILIGSIANLIVAEQSKMFGIEISFRKHAAIGIPVTIMSLIVLILWSYITVSLK